MRKEQNFFLTGKRSDALWVSRILWTALSGRRTDEELWDLSVEFTKSLFCEGENGFYGFSLGQVFIDGKWINRPYYRFEMGWTGQGIALGANMLFEAIRSGDGEAEEMGFRALDSWLGCALLSGMLPTHIEGQLAVPV
jgi:hypothetical protein